MLIEVIWTDISDVGLYSNIKKHVRTENTLFDRDPINFIQTEKNLKFIRFFFAEYTAMSDSDSYQGQAHVFSERRWSSEEEK